MSARLIRMLLFSFVVSMLLTALAVVAEATWGWDHGPYHLGTGHYPDRSRDCTYETGWVQSETGEIKRFAYNIVGFNDPGITRELRLSKLAGRPRQRTCYFHTQGGFPFLCVEYFCNYGGPYGINNNVAPEHLLYYPRYKFKGFIWPGLVGDILTWSLLPLSVCFLPSRFRRVYRRRTRRCEECGYALKGLPEARCPECGTPFDPKLLETQPQSSPHTEEAPS